MLFFFYVYILSLPLTFDWKDRISILETGFPGVPDGLIDYLQSNDDNEVVVFLLEQLRDEYPVSTKMLWCVPLNACQRDVVVKWISHWTYCRWEDMGLESQTATNDIWQDVYRNLPLSSQVEIRALAAQQKVGFYIVSNRHECHNVIDMSSIYLWRGRIV